MTDDTRYRETVLKTARESYQQIRDDLAGFLESRGLTNFGAGISGVGMDNKTLAREVLGFIYLENSKADYNAMMEVRDDED